jgi:hypothetical protein
MNDPTRKQLPPHMIGDAHHRHNRQYNRQCADMNWDKEHKDRDHQRARQRLPRMKTHCGPCSRWLAVMMHRMRQFEPEWLVHQPVGPIKPRVMREEEQHNRNRQIPDRIIGGIAINQGPAQIVPAPRHNASRHPVNGGAGQRPFNLSPNLCAHAYIQCRVFNPRRPCKSAAGQQIANTDNDGHGDSGEGYSKHYVFLAMPLLKCQCLYLEFFVHAEAQMERRFARHTPQHSSPARGGGRA